MGWKSTVDISREEAIDLILARADRNILEAKTNEELEQMLYGCNYGDDLSLPYFGHNFWVVDKIEEK